MAFSNAQQPGQINVTPLIDVLLVLIIIFLVITPKAPTGLPAAVPQKSDSPAAVAPTAPLVLAIAEDRSLQLNQQAVSREELPDRLASIAASRAQPVLFLTAYRDLEFRAVAEVIDVARAAGLERVALMP